jgi:hypothetical protein
MSYRYNGDDDGYADWNRKVLKLKEETSRNG